MLYSLRVDPCVSSAHQIRSCRESEIHYTAPLVHDVYQPFASLINTLFWITGYYHLSLTYINYFTHVTSLIGYDLSVFLVLIQLKMSFILLIQYRINKMYEST